MGHVIRRFGRESYPSARGPFAVVGSGQNVLVPAGAIPSLIVGPFPCAVGSALSVAVMVRDLSVGAMAAEGGTTSGEISWTWINNTDPSGTRSLQFTNILFPGPGADRHVDYVVTQWTP